MDNQEKVLDVHWWVPGRLFSIKTSRPKNFKFVPGQFARLGLSTDGNEPNIWRAYSMVNAADDDHLEFYAIVVPEGEFSPRLAELKVGDTIYIDDNVLGYLTLERFPQGAKNLWLIATGTGISAFLSILADPTTWDKFESVIVVHGVRYKEELCYEELIQYYQRQYHGRFVFVPLVTREANAPYPQARVTALLNANQLPELTGHTLNTEDSCVMLCGNPEMLVEARQILSEQGFKAERRGVPGNIAVEKYW